LSQFGNVQAPDVIGVLPTMFDRTTSETSTNVERLQEAIGNDLILPPIPRDTKIREAASMGETIWEYAPDSAAAIGYGAIHAKVTNSRGKIGGYLHLYEIVERML